MPPRNVRSSQQEAPQFHVNSKKEECRREMSASFCFIARIYISYMLNLSLSFFILFHFLVFRRETRHRFPFPFSNRR